MITQHTKSIEEAGNCCQDVGLADVIDCCQNVIDDDASAVILSSRSMPCCGCESWTAFPRLLRDWQMISFVFVQLSFKLFSVAQDSICDRLLAHVM